MSTEDALRRLKDLAELHTAGALTDEEFARAKGHLLGELPAGPAPDEDRTASAPKAPPDVTGAAAGTPRTQQPLRQGRQAALPRAALIVIAGSLLTLLAFFAMPIASFPFFGSITAAGLAGYSGTPGVPEGLGLLWLAPIAAFAVACIGTWEATVSDKPDRARYVVVLVLSGVVVLVYLAVFGAASASIRESGLGSSAAGLTGAGFWFALLGAAVATVGGGMGVAAAKTQPMRSSEPPLVDPTVVTARPPHAEPVREAAADLLTRPVLIGGYSMPLAVPVVAWTFAVVLFLALVIAAV